jgi:two-component system chemotaxis response regulator CheB
MAKNILVVDDSALMRRVICDIINSDSNFQATDVCRDGLEAYEKLKTTSYDGVVLDVNMPRMDGLQLLEQLQKDNIKANIIIVSTVATKDADETILALERGALDFVTKPTNIIEAKGERFKNQVLSVLTAALNSQGIPVPRKKRSSVLPDPSKSASTVKRLKATNPRSKLVALACSTGGPKALQEVIPNLSKNLDAPVVIVQHMPVGFTRPMAERLDDISPIRVTEAVDGEKLEKGHVYIAPGGQHMEVRKNPDGSHKIVLNDMPAIGGLKPCANIMYDSLTNSGYDEITCVVLTGMGADGTNGILTLCQHRPVHVIAQNAQTCVVYGMPRTLVETGIVDEIVPLNDVAGTINKYVGER